jgi:hypothetical protein
MIRNHRVVLVVLAMALTLGVAPAASAKQPSGAAAPNPAASEKSNGHAYSGMYTFLKEGEFLQVSVEADERVSGFISRYEDEDSDKGTFVDQFFKSAKLDGNKLTFTTKTVHGVWFDFNGTVERGEGKNPGDEAYYVLKGTLTESSLDAENKVTSRNREAEFKMFPQEISPPAQE